MKAHLYTKENFTKVALVLVIIGSMACNVYLFWRERDENLKLLVITETLGETVTDSIKKLSALKNENVTINAKLSVEQANNVFFQDQIQNISGTVKVLEKLSKTDTELLKKYSKVYFLNENYIPPQLTNVDEKFLYVKDKPVQVHTEIWPHLQKLLLDAEAQGVQIQVISGYRSFGTQAYLKSSYTVTYGAGTANKFSADQGYSEHQLGTTIDFTTPKLGTSFVGFEKTDAYNWLLQNAYKYGFIVSYPKENKYYSFEPWHWRFVSLALSTKLQNDKNYFYALEQRDIDQYLVNFFD